MEIARASLSLRDSITRISHESSAFLVARGQVALHHQSTSFLERERERGRGEEGGETFLISLFLIHKHFRFLNF